MFKSLSHFKFIFMYEKRLSSNFHRFTCSCSTLPTPPVEETTFPIVCSCFLCQRFIMSVWVYLWALYSLLLILMSVFVPIPHCFDYGNFVVLSEVWEHYASCFYFPLRIALVILGLLWFHINFLLFALVLCEGYFLNSISLLSPQ